MKIKMDNEKRTTLETVVASEDMDFIQLIADICNKKLALEKAISSIGEVHQPLPR